MNKAFSADVKIVPGAVRHSQVLEKMRYMRLSYSPAVPKASSIMSAHMMPPRVRKGLADL
jgi:hypothetical protein